MAKVKSVEQILEVAVSELIRKGEDDKKQVSAILSAVVKFAQDTKNIAFGKIEQFESDLKERVDSSLLSIKEGVEQRLNRTIDKFSGELDKMSKEHTRAINYLYDRVANLRDGLDADPEDVVDIVMQRLPKQEGADTSDLKQRIADLEEKIEKLRKMRVTDGGGGGTTLFGSVGHSPVHETFTMNGSDTTVTLRRGVAAQGTAIMVRYQGQMLDLTSQYTVNGNKVTFVGFTPEASTVISVTYWG